MKNQLSLFKSGKLRFVDNIENILKKVVKKMVDENIKVDGWCLDEVPLNTVFCFYHPENQLAFDIVVSENGELVPYYSGKETIEGINSFPTVTIQEAIEKYIIE